MTYNLERICLDALEISKKIIKESGEKGFGNLTYKTKVDPVTLADEKISRGIKNYFIKEKFPTIIYDEELREIKLTKNPEYIVVVDPLDGTDNYLKGKGILLPYSSIISIAEYKNKIKIKDFTAAGIVEHTSGNIWYAEKGKGLKLNGKEVCTTDKKTLDGKTNVFVDLGPIPSLKEIKRTEKIRNSCWARNISSAGIHFSYVSCGGADGFVSFKQKPEELAAGYLIMKEAGGVVLDTKGKDVGENVFDFDKLCEIVAAATPELAEEIISKLR